MDDVSWPGFHLLELLKPLDYNEDLCSSLPSLSSLVMPLVCKDMVDILDVGVNSTNANHTSLSNFAFLYGVFPTAPSVAIYAAHYNMELEVVSTVHRNTTLNNNL